MKIKETNSLFFAKVKPNAIIPSKRNEDAGYDIYPCFDEKFIIILPHETKLIPTGIASAFSDDYYIQIQERGSTGAKGIKYGAGVIDSGYRGEWFIPITNSNDVPIVISSLSEQEWLEDNQYEELIASNSIYTITNVTDLADFDDNENITYKIYMTLISTYGLNFDIIDDLDVLNHIPNVINVDQICNPIFYSKNKAIAQAIVHKLPKMNIEEISFNELQNIESNRGLGNLGSSNK